jgi:hypothetical protein
MSKLAKQINAIFEGKITASRSMKYVNVTKSVMDDPVSYNRHYKVSATFEQTRVVDRFGTDKFSDNISEEALKDIKRAIIEEVFGEFRPLLYEMKAAIYDEDFYRLRETLAKLEIEMFHDGI